MKRKNKHLLRALACLCLCLTLLPAAASPAVDTARDGSITIICRYGEAPVSGVPFDLYLVAEVDADGAFTLTGDFARYPVSLTGLTGSGWNALAETLSAYARRDGLIPLQSGVTGGDGRLTFSGLKPGLYLVVGQTVQSGTFFYATDPFLVSLPSKDEATDQWSYDLSVTPKYTGWDTPDTPEEDTVSRRVLKIWEDGGDESARPERVTVTLLKNGEVYDVVILSAQNNWRYDWASLPRFDENGLPIRWQVVEDAVPGYTVTVSREGTTLLITNTREPDPPPSETPPSWDSPAPSDSPSPTQPQLPQTGALWWPVPLLAAAGLGCLLAGGVFRRRARHE